MDLEKITRYLELATEHVERLTGVKSRWNGTLELVDEVDAIGKPAFRGKKGWNCAIVIHSAFLGNNDLFSTLVHEAFHAVSVGVSFRDLQMWRGYEEGVVEWLTRRYTETIAAELGVDVAENRSSFQRYINSLETLRAASTKGAEEFYLRLVITPLALRESRVLEWIMETGKWPSLVLAHLQWAEPLRSLRT